MYFLRGPELSPARGSAMLLGIVVLARFGGGQWSPEAPRKRNSYSSLDSARDTLLRSLWWRRNASGKGKPVKARTAASGPLFFDWQGCVTDALLFVCGTRAAFPFASPALDPALWALTSVLLLRRESPPRPLARRP